MTITFDRSLGPTMEVLVIPVETFWQSELLTLQSPEGH